MKMKLAYEISDMRTIRPDQKLGLVGIIESAPGGVIISSDNLRGLKIDLTDDEDPDNPVLEDNEAEGVITFHTPQGVVRLEKLTLQHKEHLIAFSVYEKMFTDDDALNDWYYNYVKALEK
jgi:hypothetical protein